MRFVCLAIGIGMLVPLTAQAVGLARFDFNSLDNNASTGTIVSTTGSGTLTTVSGPTTFFGFSTGSSDPEAGENDSAWGVGGFPAQGTASGTVGWQATVSTVGFNSVRLLLDQKNQPSSNKWYDVQVRTAAAGPFTPVATYGIVAADIWENAKTFDLTSLIPSAGNNPDFAVRVVAVFAPSTSQYAASEASYNGQISTLFDMITVNGFVVPEPSTGWMAISGLSMVIACVRRRNAAT